MTGKKKSLLNGPYRERETARIELCLSSTDIQWKKMKGSQPITALITSKVLLAYFTLNFYIKEQDLALSV